MSEYRVTTTCPWCERTKRVLRQVGGVEAPPGGDRMHDVVVCDVCGCVYLFAGRKGGPLGVQPSATRGVAIAAQMPVELCARRDGIRAARREAVHEAVRVAMKSYAGMSCDVGELVGMLHHRLQPKGPAKREVIEALWQMERSGTVLSEGVAEKDLFAQPLRWRWAGGS